MFSFISIKWKQIIDQVIPNQFFKESHYARLSYPTKRAKVVASCEQEIALDPNNAKAWFKHGVALYTLGLYSEAITSYDKAIALDPNYSAAKQNREVALKKQSQQ